MTKGNLVSLIVYEEGKNLQVYFVDVSVQDATYTCVYGMISSIINHNDCCVL